MSDGTYNNEEFVGRERERELVALFGLLFMSKITACRLEEGGTGGRGR